MCNYHVHSDFKKIFFICPETFKAVFRHHHENISTTNTVCYDEIFVFAIRHTGRQERVAEKCLFVV